MLRYLWAFVVILTLGAATAYGAVMTDAPTPVPVVFLICLALFGIALADGREGWNVPDQD